MSKYGLLWNHIKNCDKDIVELTFEEIGKIAGVAVDHSFLKYKSELTEYGWEVRKISIKAQAVLFARAVIHNDLVLYVHGKGGSVEEAEHYKRFFPDYEVIGLDYKAETPWQAKEEFSAEFNKISERYNRVILIANSIGAYFSMCALPQEKIEKAYFVSPIVDMEKLIENTMTCANVSERDLCKQGEIQTSFGETLSWKYLLYVRENPVDWTVPTEILYGEKDYLTSLETITAFAGFHNAGLTVMKNGEHWFHTAEQMNFLDEWIKQGEKD